jgi:ketol-acid reductoisomerase
VEIRRGIEASPLSSFNATRRLLSEHRVEQVGETLRAMVPWISKNALGDKTTT